MKYWQWVEGRQKETKYKKFCLWSFRLQKYGFDAYILKYEPHTTLKYHTDAVNGGEHHRTNIKLFGSAVFCYWVDAMNLRCTHNRVVSFRPDLQSHSLTVGSRQCIKLSFGYVKYK